ncbi:PREDICTED: ribonuclease P protein subunit p30 [Bactrocera latifrons]|uniref:Ribonuclease P protein subunit p30 n=1 Tax=Bactrocera latifrons TaxID=174628 RepID=A0A0K8TZZ0_BACLA|nr:PREDICTED: ribonuclease P protein subunit p30 [Bactrocera latifrons]
MEKTYPFYDLCIPYQKDSKALKEIIKEAISLGYKTVAIEQVFDHSRRDATKRVPDIFPPPVAFKSLEDEFKNQLRILQRLTILYVDVSVAHAMTNSLNLKKYDLVAGQPKTDAALTHCCTTFAGDLVTFDTDGGVKLLVNRKAYQIGVKRGLFFEIKYGPAIRDSNVRKDMIKLAHNYCVRGKTKSLIFSSGATNPFELRGPYDVANLAYIFGLSEDQGKNAVNKACRQLFLRAQGRRIGKTFMFVRSTGPVVFSDSSDSDDDDSEQAAADDSDENEEMENFVDTNSPEPPSKKKKKLV